MITTIRNQFKHTTYRYIVFFMVFIIAMSMVSSLLIKTERSISSWAVRVNGAEISLQDFNREAYKQSQYLAQMRAQYGQYADLLFQSLGWSLDSKERALDTLIKEELLVQYASRLGLCVHEDYVSKIINNASLVKKSLGHLIPPFVFDQSGVLDTNILNAFLRQNGISAKQFEQDIERSLIQQQLIGCVSSTSYVPLFDIKQEFIAKNLGKKFSYLTFSFDQFLANEKKKSIADDALESFFKEQNIKFRRYWVAEKRTAYVWKFESGNYNASISEQDIQEYYDDNKVKSYTLDPLKVEVQKITLKQVQDVSPDASLEDVRQDLVSNAYSVWAKQWKLMKPFARGEYNDELEKASFVLQNEGDISPVFQTKDGEFAIVRLVKRIPRTYKPLSSVKGEIKNILTQRTFKKHFVKDIKKIVSQADQKAIEDFVKNNEGKKELSVGVTKDGSRLSQELFSLKKGDYGFYIDKEVGVVVLLSDITEPYLPDLNSIKEVVKGDLYEHKAQVALQKNAEQAYAAIDTKTLEELAASFGAQLNNLDINPTDEKKLKDFNAKGLPVSQMMNLEKTGSVFIHKAEKNSFIVKMDAMDSFDDSLFQAIEKDIKNHLGPVRARLLLDGFVASLHKNATIEINESILTIGEEYSE